MIRKRNKSRGQSTVEFVLMLAFGAAFAVQVFSFFNGVFSDGLLQLEKNVETESRSGSGFGP